MFTITSRIVFVAAVLLTGMMLTPTVSACCPDGGNGTPVTKSGLGESFPVATDLAVDPAWQVYEFERSGIRYVQVNDRYGVVRAAAGRIGDTVWVLPIGTDADRVMTTEQPAPTGTVKTLYRSEDIEVVLYRTTSGDRWVIQSLDAGL